MIVQANTQRPIAVLFGGQSPEHDVSIVTALQVMDALDPRAFRLIPIYCDFDGGYVTGPALRRRDNFRPKPTGKRGYFAWTDDGPGLVCDDKSTYHFDAVIMAYHGLYGEDGREQAHLERLGIPYTGFTSLYSALAMRKDMTKEFLAPTGIRMLPHAVLERPVGGGVPSRQQLQQTLEELAFPLILKPCSLGSSIGVALVQNLAEVEAVLPSILAKDNRVLAEPQVQNLIEYNIAVRMTANGPITSAIEQPKTDADLLDFKEKYLSAGGGKKGLSPPSEGMLSLTRDINPALPPDREAQIRSIATLAFERLGQRGAPRFDFLYDSEAGDLYFNEVNPIPGSFGHFLWEAASQPLLFPDLLAALVHEALGDTLRNFGDPVPNDARLLARSG